MNLLVSLFIDSLFHSIIHCFINHLIFCPSAPQETYSFWDKRYYASVWDTLYGPDSLLNKKVKFSEDEDLTEEECHSLLMEFMPECMQNVKITQKLFVR